MQYRTKPRWTQKQVNFLIENWDKMKDEDIAASLGRSLKSVRKKREYMELKKKNGRGIVAAADDANSWNKRNEYYRPMNKTEEKSPTEIPEIK